MNQERLMKVLLAPIVSEKATMMADKNQQVAFRVMQDATKAEIKAAEQQGFGEWLLWNARNEYTKGALRSNEG